MYNPDPYGVDEWEQQQEDFSMDNNSQEQILYERLLGAYHSMPQSDNPHSATEQPEQWEVLNSIMDKLVALGHSHYSELKVQPTSRTYNGRSRQTLSIATLRMNMMSALRMMSREFSCADPGYELSRYGAATNFSVNQTANPVNHANAQQEQNQHQEQSMSIEQSIELAVEKIRQDYGDEKATQAKEQLDSLKSNKSWDNVKSVIKFFADMGKQAFVAVSPVIAAALIANAL